MVPMYWPWDSPGSGVDRAGPEESSKPAQRLPTAALRSVLSGRPHAASRATSMVRVPGGDGSRGGGVIPMANSLTPVVAADASMGMAEWRSWHPLRGSFMHLINGRAGLGLGVGAPCRSRHSVTASAAQTHATINTPTGSQQIQAQLR